MRDFKKLFENCKSVSYKLNENSLEFSGSSKLVNLIGSYVDSKLSIELKSKNGNTLYSFNESINDDELAYNKVVEAVDIFDSVSDIDADLEREDDDKEILLDDADVSEEEVAIDSKEVEDEVVVDEEETTTEETFDDEEITKVDMSVFSKIRDELLNIANDNVDIADAISDNDAEVKSLAVGLLAKIYDCVNEFNAFIEYFTYEKLDESLFVPAKVDYTDLASRGISQACVALKNCKNYEPLIGILKDINSELKLKD